MFTTGIVLKICMQHTDESKPCCAKAMFLGVEAGVFGVEASTRPTPLDRTLACNCIISKVEVLG